MGFVAGDVGTGCRKTRRVESFVRSFGKRRCENRRAAMANARFVYYFSVKSRFSYPFSDKGVRNGASHDTRSTEEGREHADVVPGEHTCFLAILPSAFGSAGRHIEGGRPPTLSALTALTCFAEPARSWLYDSLRLPLPLYYRRAGRNRVAVPEPRTGQLRTRDAEVSELLRTSH